MLKENNDWLNHTKEVGLYFGCYGDMLTVKIGQTLKGIYKRSQEIERNSGFGFTIQYYIPFTNLWEDKKKNTIFALAMEDLVHDWMTQFCNTKDFHKYRGEDHYECSVKGCENFFNYFEEHEKEIKNYFNRSMKRIHTLLDKFDEEYDYDEQTTSNVEIAIAILRQFNGISKTRIYNYLNREKPLPAKEKEALKLREFDKAVKRINKINEQRVKEGKPKYLVPHCPW